MRKGKKKTMFPVAYFSYFQYTWVITIFDRGFNNWIIDVICDRVAVNISAILRLLRILEKKVFRICPVVTGANPFPYEKKKNLGFPQTLSKLIMASN